MKISFADLYKNRISDKKFQEFKKFLESKKMPSVENKLDNFLDILREEIIEKFNINKIDFPYYHYFPNSVYKKEEILIDVSINDDFLWQSKENKKSNLTIPKELKKLLKNYQELSVGETVSFKTGYYRTENPKTRKIEEKFMSLTDGYFKDLQKILLKSSNWREKSEVVLLLGYAVENSQLAIDTLLDALKDKDHSVHNMAARSLFPKIYTNQSDFWVLRDLFNHHNPYCQNKFMGTAANVKLDQKSKRKLQKIKEKIKEKTKYSQGIVSFAAKSLLDKI